MRPTIVFVLGILLSLPVFSCNNWMPESTAIFAQANGGTRQDSVMDCKAKPEEACVCFDEVVEWTATSLVDRYVKDESRPIYAHDCPAGREGCRPVGYEEKIEGKKIISDSIKLNEVRQIEASKREAEQAKNSQARDKVKSCTRSYMSSNAKTAECVEALFELIE